MRVRKKRLYRKLGLYLIIVLFLLIGGAYSYLETIIFTNGIVNIKSYCNPVMRSYASNSSDDYHSSTYRSKITKIVTKNDINIPDDAIKDWDVSEAGNGSVVAYIEDDGSGNGTYKVTIGGDGAKAIANEDSSNLFYSFRALKEIDLSNLDTSNVTDMSNMFSYCSSFTSLDLSNLDTNSVTNMSFLFSGCSSLTSLNLSNLVLQVM